MPDSYRFVIALYGNRHRAILLPLLYSIKKTNPSAKVSLLWEEIDNDFMGLIMTCFPKFEFIKTSFHFENDVTKRISSKTIMWEYGVRQKPDEYIALVDADTLVVKDISFFFNQIQADIIFTVDHENKYPINSGVLLCHSMEKVQSFFSDWKKETKHIIETLELYRQSNDKSLPYGGADQLALHRLICFEKNKNIYMRNGIVFKGVPRYTLNETNSGPITKETCIIHYKGGWYNILFKAGNFTKNRTKKVSWEMYLYYLNCYKEALEYANTRLESKVNPKYFGLVIPFYINAKTLSERKWLYPVYHIYTFMKFLPSRIKKLIYERWS